MKKVSKNLISVIVPIYNAEKYLSECINSIINQDYKNIEIILVNDGSQDLSLNICEEYAKKDKRIIIINKRNAGVSAARNDGIIKANGEWITFVDADDWIEKNYISSMYKIATQKKVNYVTCGYNRIYKNKAEKINSSNNILTFKSRDYIKILLNVQNGYGFCHMKLIKKDLARENPFNTRIKVGEDALFNISICSKIDKIAVLNKCLYNYRFNSTSVVRKYDKNYVEKYKISMEIMRDYIISHYPNDEQIIQCLYNYISYHVLLISVNYCYHPKNNNKLKSLIQIFKIPIFAESIKKSNFKDLSISRKITLLTLKTKLYFLTGAICRIRQLQFKK